METSQHPLLSEYGIQTEQSDLRAHVCVTAGMVYVFRTTDALRVLGQGEFGRGYATQPGVTSITGTGYLVPVTRLPAWAIGAEDAIAEQRFQKTDTTTVKGEKAACVVRRLIQDERFPLAVAESADAGIDAQLAGVDLIVGRQRVQVKCDYDGGLGVGCTGNLFLQIAECNPFKAT